MKIHAIDSSEVLPTVPCKKTSVVVSTSTEPTADQIQDLQIRSGKGCGDCSLNNQSKLVKIIGVKKLDADRAITIWLPYPTAEDNAAETLPTQIMGRFIWQELKRAGIDKDSCNVQSVVRCFPSEQLGDYLRERPPSKDEVDNCRYWTVKAIAKLQGTTKVHILFGQFTATTLLGKVYKKDKPIFWSSTLNATVICVDHPSYFIKGAPELRLEQFRQKLKTAASTLLNKSRWSYLEKQDYKLVTTVEDTKLLYKQLLAQGNERTSVDVEYGEVNGAITMVVVGFCPTPGIARVVVLDHPENKESPATTAKVKKILCEMLGDKRIRKTMHYGVSDTEAIQNLLNTTVKGFSRDTNYTSYLKNPDWRSHSLDAQSKERCQEFVGYKEMIEPFIRAPDGTVNYARIPLSVMRLYNGADCDLTKRVDIATSDVNKALAETYMHASFITTRMERTGPWLDKEYFKVVNKAIPLRLAKIAKKLRKIAGDPDINLNSPTKIVEVMYGKLRFPVLDPKGKKSTNEQTLKLLKDYPNGKFCSLLMEFRGLSKMVSTYLNNYENSAKLNGGRLRTKWWLIGTITGRLRSGGSKKGDDGIVNMQNLHGEPILKNLLVSDPNWPLIQKLLKYKSIKDVPDKLWNKLENLKVFISADYSQVEIRILAQMSKDPLLIKHCHSEDLHSLVGSALTGWSVDKIKNDEQIRTTVKGIHFGIIYGLTPKNLYLKLKAEGVDISSQLVDKLYKEYFRKYSYVARLIERLKAFAEKNKYVPTMFGFRRPIVMDDSDRGTFWGNQAVNSPIQGSAHQLMLFAMALIYLRPKSLTLLQDPVMEVHDAFVFFGNLKDIANTYTSMLQLLEKDVVAHVAKKYNIEFNVPLKAEAKVGLRYGMQSKYFGGSWKQFIFNYARTNEEQSKAIDDKWLTHA